MKIWKEGQLNLLKGYPKEVVDSVNEAIRILNDNYGSERNVDKDLGVTHDKDVADSADRIINLKNFQVELNK